MSKRGMKWAWITVLFCGICLFLIWLIAPVVDNSAVYVVLYWSTFPLFYAGAIAVLYLMVSHVMRFARRRR